MTASDDIKNLLNIVYGKADWKRRSKTKLDNLFELREFEEPKSGFKVQVYTSLVTGRHIPFNGQKLVYGAWKYNTEAGFGFGEPFVVAKLKNQSDLIAHVKTMAKIQAYIYPELANPPSDIHALDVILKKYNIDHSPELTKALMEEYGEQRSYSQNSSGVTIISITRNNIPNPPQIDEDDDEEYFESWDPKDKVLFAVNDYGDDGIVACFNTESFWRVNKCLWDQHLETQLEKQGYKIPKYLEELCENQFSVHEPGMTFNKMRPKNHTVDSVKADLIKAGFIFSQEMTDQFQW